MARTPSRSPTAMLGVGLLVVAVAVTAGLPRLLGSVAGPANAITAELRQRQKDGFRLSVGQKVDSVRSSRAQFDRITVTPAGTSSDHPETWVASATLDFDGTWGDTTVSSLGLEQIPFQFRDGAWRPTQGWAPRLTRALELLDARRVALQVGERGRLSALSAGADGGMPVPARGALSQVFDLEDRKYEVRAWYLRFERDGVQATEEYRLQGHTAERPFDESGARTWTLIPGGGERFLFAGNVL